MKKLLAFSLAFLTIAIFPTQHIPASATTFSYAVMDMENGEIVLSKCENEKHSVASLTKIVTAITALENIESLDARYFVPHSATVVEGSSIYLQDGEEISVRELLFGLMLRSGNDSATMLMQIVGGNANGFSNLMNELAQNVGATNSHFENPHGLENANHFSTAADLCKITRYAMSNPTFADIVSTKFYKGERTTYQNKNKMLWNYSGANGVKTGFTTKSGRCLVTTATQNEKSFVCVVLNCPDMWNISTQLLDKAFATMR
ncbi:MAG: serine hydrolase [Clostridia bacterium]